MRRLNANAGRERKRREHRKRDRRRRPGRQRRLAIEPLEDRCLLATFVVDTLDDQNDGVGVGGVSLRDAIVAANSNDE